MALGSTVPSTTFVVVYNPSKYIANISNGQSSDRLEALTHLLECILHSDSDLITLGSIWLCLTNLLNNEEQYGSINADTRVCALKCIVELIKLEKLQRRFFNLWLSFDFLVRYKIVNETDAALWLECFYTLTDHGKRIDLIDDRIRARVFVQLINGILTGPMSRNTQAHKVLRESLTLNCDLRHDEISLILENIFRQLNRDDDDSSASSHQILNQSSIRKSLEFLAWIVDYHTLDTGLLHFFITNVVDLHDKDRFSSIINTELLQLITNHLAKVAWHNISVIGVISGIISDRLEKPLGSDSSSTLLFVLTQTLIDVRQSLSINQSHVQVSASDKIHRKCLLNSLRQLPVCWLTTLHKVLVKRQNLQIILINFKQFLLTIKVPNSNCALNIFEMVVWKMMDEIMRISHQHVIVEKSTIGNVRTIYEECLTVFEDLALRLCCLPQRMLEHLFDIKNLTSVTRTSIRERMIKESSRKLLRFLRPNNLSWTTSFQDISQFVILNNEENFSTRIELLKNIFEKYFWFKMTDQVAEMGRLILETLENLIDVDFSSIDEKIFFEKFAALRDFAIESIFTQFLSDNSIEPTVADFSYKILHRFFDENSNLSPMSDLIQRQTAETIVKQLCFLLETNLTYSRLIIFNHVAPIFNFFKKISLNYRNFLLLIQPQIRIDFWKILLQIRLRISDYALGIYSTNNDQNIYGVFRADLEQKLIDFENVVELSGYLLNFVDCLRLETNEVLESIFFYLNNFLKEQFLVNLSQIPTDDLMDFLVEKFEENFSKNFSENAMNCLISCSCYQRKAENIDKYIKCLIEGSKTENLKTIRSSIEGLVFCLWNFEEQIGKFLAQITDQFRKLVVVDNEISKMILEFFMHYLFNEKFDESLTGEIVKILLGIFEKFQEQSGENLLLAQTNLCFFFEKLSEEKREIFSYFILRSLERNSSFREFSTSNVEKTNRFHRSGSLSSLNEDFHNGEISKRKLTILEVSPTVVSPSVDENNSLRKLNEELVRITIDFVNDRSVRSFLPSTTLLFLPRDFRRRHTNQLCLANERILYQIKSFDFNEFFCHYKNDFNQINKNRFRRYTDGNRKSSSTKFDRRSAAKAQDDLHLRSFDSETNRSIFNESNLWIPVTVRTATSTKNFLVLNSTGSPPVDEMKNSQIFCFEAVQISDTKPILNRKQIDYSQDEKILFEINKNAILDDFRSIIENFDRKDEQILRNRHIEDFLPDRFDRIPSDARKSIDSIDNVDPVRVAKIGLVFIRTGQEITETNILSNIRTSKRFEKFVSSLASLRSIEQLQQENFYCPLLDAKNSENCGQFSYVWQNSIFQVLFHSSTTMPNTRSDHEFKKKLIGNDYVIIVFNETEQLFDMKMLKTGVCKFTIEVSPQNDSNFARIRVKRKISTGATSPNSTNNSSNNSILILDQLVLEDRLGPVVRLLALIFSQNAELETRQKSSPNAPFLISPWQNRLHTLKSLHTRSVLSYKQQQ